MVPMANRLDFPILLMLSPQTTRALYTMYLKMAAEVARISFRPPEEADRNRLVSLLWTMITSYARVNRSYIKMESLLLQVWEDQVR